MILDGTLLPIDRIAADRPFCSGKHKKHGMNVQVIADPQGRLIWASPAWAGAVHDVRAAREHGIIKALAEEEEVAGWVWLRLQCGQALWQLGRTAEALAELEESAGRAEAHGLHESAGHALELLSWITGAQEHAERRAALAARAEEAYGGRERGVSGTAVRR